MAKQSIITDKGLELLASSSEVTGQYYWLGYYSLAYVPNYWKDASAELPSCKPNGDPSTRDFTEEMASSMTQLTTSGDMIYNVFQGDLTGTGYFSGASDGTSGGDLFGLSMYDQNIKKHYRYVLDSAGKNNLVSWEIDSAATDGSMVGKYVYTGTDGFTESEMAIPAPLYYIGDVSDKSSVSNFFPDFDDSVINGSSIYPFVDLQRTGPIDLDIPKVTVDTRGYLDSLGVDTAIYSSTGAFFDSNEVPASNAGYDETDWFSASHTLIQDDDNLGVDSTIAKGLWKLVSVSNYNRYHAPVNSIGHVLQSDLKNRNMAKTTKFFPISNYKVINSQTGFTQNTETRELATALSLGINIDITPNTKGPGFDDATFDFDNDASLTFFDKYDRSDDTPTLEPNASNSIFNTTTTSFKFNRIGIYAVPLRKAPYVINESDPSGKSVEVEFEINPDDEPVLFSVVDWDNTVYMSDDGNGLAQFRSEFNVNLDGPLTSDASCLIRDTTIFYNLYQDDSQKWYQNQLIANASTQNAITEFGLEVAHIKSKVNEIACCPPPNFDDRYSMKNHSHGNTLRNLIDSNIAVDGGLKGIDTHAEGDITVIPEGYEMGSHSVAIGFDTIAETDRSLVQGNTNRSYNLIGAGNVGVENVVLGGSVNSIIDGYRSTLIGGTSNLIQSLYDSGSIETAAMLGGRLNQIIRLASGELNYDSIILGGSENIISGFNTAIISSKQSHMHPGTEYSLILGGVGHVLNGGVTHSVALGGDYNVVELGSEYSFIGPARYSTITSGSAHAFIGSGSSHMIGNGSTSVTLLGGNHNAATNSSLASGIMTANNSSLGTIRMSVTSIVGDGAEVNVRVESGYGFGADGDVGGNYVRIHDTSTDENVVVFEGNIDSVSGGGATDYIYNFVSVETTFNFTSGYLEVSRSGSSNSFIGGGSFNSIALHDSPSDNSVIGGGFDNAIYGGVASGILSGWSVHLSGDYSSILGGLDGHLVADRSSMLNGYACSVLDTYSASSYVTHGGGQRNTVDSSTYTVLGGGWANSVTRGISVVLSGGFSNTIGDATDTTAYATIGGGYDNEIKVGVDYATIPGGSGATATHHGELAHASGKFSDGYGGSESNGKAQRSVLILRGVVPVPSGVAFGTTSTDPAAFMASEEVPQDVDGILTLDGVRTAGDPNFVTVGVGESMTGTIMNTAHIPWATSSGFQCYLSDNDDSHYNGGSVYEYSAFTAHRSHKVTNNEGITSDGAMLVASQLMSSTASSPSLLPVSDYGLQFTFDTRERFTGEIAYSDTDSAGRVVSNTLINGTTEGLNKEFGDDYADGHADSPSYVSGRLVVSAAIEGLAYYTATQYVEIVLGITDTNNATHIAFAAVDDGTKRYVADVTNTIYTKYGDVGRIYCTSVIDATIISDSYIPTIPS
jgi:hypothetical protein